MVRIKQRYILGELVFKDDNTVDCSLESKQVADGFRNAVQENYGDLGYAQVKQNFISKILSFTFCSEILERYNKSVYTQSGQRKLGLDSKQFDYDDSFEPNNAR